MSYTSLSSQSTKVEKKEQVTYAEDRPSDGASPHMFTRAENVAIADSQVINAGRDVTMTYLGSDNSQGAYGYPPFQTTSQQTVYQQRTTVQTPPGNNNWGDKNPFRQFAENPTPQTPQTPQTGGGDTNMTVLNQKIRTGGNINTNYHATGNLTSTTQNSTFVAQKSFNHTSRGRNVQETFDGVNIEAAEDVNISSFSGSGNFSW